MSLKTLGLQKIYLDFNSKIINALSCNNADVATRGLEVHIMNGSAAFDCTGVTLKLFVRTTNLDVYESTSATAGGVTGVFEVLYPEGMPGGLSMGEIVLTDTPEIIGSFHFPVNIIKSLISDGSLTEAPGAGILFNVISNENARVAAELARTSAELARITEFNNMIANGYIKPISPVDTFADLATTYPAPVSGWTSKTLDDSKIYRYSGTAWIWIDTVAVSVYDAVLNAIDDISLNIKNIVAVAMNFGITTTNPDNHDNFIDALDYLKVNGGGTLQLPSGIFLTSPISFEGYDNIIIKGVGRSMPWTTNTTIKIIGTNPSGSVGLQFTDTENVTPAWSAKCCKLENLYLDCDSKCDYGINGNFGLWLLDVHVRYAIYDGIVAENYTYPFFIEKSYSEYNGRHGLHIKGLMTTVYDFDIECSYNNGYGMVIEAGASARIKGLCQTNKQGGYKLNYISGFFNNIVIDVYTEANGTLEASNVNYEGNYAAIITGVDKTSNAVNKPKNIVIKGALQPPTNVLPIAPAKALKIDAVYGCKIEAFITGTIDITAVGTAGVYGVEFASNGTISAVNAIGTGNALQSYFGLSGVPSKFYKGGIFPTRGRVVKYEFYVNRSVLTANNSVYAIPCISLGADMQKPSAYPSFKLGSIIGISARKESASTTVGAVTIKATYGFDTGYTGGATTEFATTSFELNSANGYVNSITLDPYAVALPAAGNFGVKLTASADYNQGAHGGYIITVLAEY